jgi:hypothetical protein
MIRLMLKDGRCGGGKVSWIQEGFSLPAVSDEGVVSTGGAEVEAGDVGCQGCARVVRWQPVVTAEHWRLIRSVAWHAPDFVGQGVSWGVKGFR